MNDLETRLYQAFGIEPPAEGGNGQDVADPAAGETDDAAGSAENEELPAPESGEVEGENEQDVAEPAVDEEDKPAQSREERARNAARRRKAQQQAAVEAARKEEREKYEARINSLIARAGFRDGETVIETPEQLEDYLNKAEQARIQRELKAGRLTPEVLEGIVDRAVARKTAENTTEEEALSDEEPAAEHDETNQAAFQAQVETELEEIRRYDPSVKTVGDLLKLDKAEAIRKEVFQHGHSYLEAYRFVYAEEIAAKNIAAQNRREAASARSKSHMTPHTARGAGDVAVPAETMAYYRRMNPKATPEEIRRHYNMTIRNGGG